MTARCLRSNVVDNHGDLVTVVGSQDVLQERSLARSLEELDPRIKLLEEGTAYQEAREKSDRKGFGLRGLLLLG